MATFYECAATPSGITSTGVWCDVTNWRETLQTKSGGLR